MLNQTDSEVPHQPILNFFAWSIWARLPAPVQFIFSRLHAWIYECSWSRYFIRPYMIMNYVYGQDYVKEFGPASGASRYRSFQDFFTRRIVVPRPIESTHVWPCDGLLCETGRLADLDLVNIKGEHRSVKDVFGSEFTLRNDSYFANIFLHNSDYHRIHAPVTGVISKIVHIPGELRFLRPWFYRQPTLPALTNERINIEIAAVDESANETRNWLLSIVGGPGVATIIMNSAVQIGTTVMIGQELGLFRLGSTCCLLSPIPITELPGRKVRMGNTF